MISGLLSQLGLTDKQIAIYLKILEHRTLTPAQVSNLTGINRTTVYSVSKELLKLGVISEDLGGVTRTLVARPPVDLKRVILHKEKEIAKQRQVVQRAVDELQSLAQGIDYAVPKIIFVPEEDLEQHLYRQTGTWNKSCEQYDNLWWGFQDSSFVRHYEEWIDWFWVSHETSSNIHLKLISDKKAERIKGKKYKKRVIKFWDKSENFTATTWVLGDYVVMIITNQRPHYLVEIHDKTLAHNMREVFRGLWEEIN